MAKKQKKVRNSEEMSFLDHLEELRWHLIRSTFAVLVAAVVAFIAKDFIFNTIRFAPKDPNFITYRWLCNIDLTLGLSQDAYVTEIPYRIKNRTIAGQFNIHIWTAITTGVIVAFPYILYEMWRFIEPALKETEKRNSQGFIGIASILFFLGVLFGYFI